MQTNAQQKAVQPVVDFEDRLVEWLFEELQDVVRKYCPADDREEWIEILGNSLHDYTDRHGKSGAIRWMRREITGFSNLPRV